MKLSNKILIGFLGLIFLYITAAFTEIRLRGTTYLLDDESSIAETADITGVNYLILADVKENIRVIGSDTPRLEVRSISGDLLRKLTYEVSRNTLNLEELNLDEDQAIRITIYVSKNNFKGMTVKGANVTVQGLEQNELIITQKAGWITMSGKNRIDKLIIESSLGHLEISDSHMDTISVQLENSQIRVVSPIKFLEGSASDASTLRMSMVEEIQFKKDESSMLIFE